MRTKLLLSFVAFTLLFSLTLQGQKQPVSGGLNVRQKFESEISNLKKNLNTQKKTDEKLKALQKSEKDLEILRKKNPIQVDPDELYMDHVTSSLSLIPRGAQFKKEKCEDYRTSILFAFSPQNPEKPMPPIAETLSILDLLCQ